MAMDYENTGFDGADVLITFEKEGEDFVRNVQARITKMSTSGGAADTETTYTFGGNTFLFNKPADDYEVSFDYVTTDAMWDRVLHDYAASGVTSSTYKTSEYRSGNEQSKARWRVILWFLGNGASTRAKSSDSSIVIPLKKGEILRYIFKDCYSISNDVDFSADDMSKGTVTLKCAPKDTSGYANVFKQYTSAQATTALTTLNATAHGGTLLWATTAASVAWTGSYRT